MHLSWCVFLSFVLTKNPRSAFFESILKYLVWMVNSSEISDLKQSQLTKKNISASLVSVFIFIVLKIYLKEFLSGEKLWLFLPPCLTSMVIWFRHRLFMKNSYLSEPYFVYVFLYLIGYVNFPINKYFLIYIIKSIMTR